jgi:hypothetical protein
MNPNLTILDSIRVASPCPAKWSEMIGDDRTRFCGSCEKHVYNISAMTVEEATMLIREREGNLCARLFRRADGTVMTADCPVGARAVWRRMKQLAAACGAAALIGIGGLMLPNVVTGRSSGRGITSGPVAQKVSALWDDLLVWIGVRQRFAVAGAICIPLTPSGASSVGDAAGEGSSDGSPEVLP